MSEMSSAENADSDSPLAFGRIDPPHTEIPQAAAAQPTLPTAESVPRPRWKGPPQGMRRAAADGTEWLDALAGRASLFGFGFQPHIDAITSAAHQYLGDALNRSDAPEQRGESANHLSDVSSEALLVLLRDYLQGDSAVELASVTVTAAADLAIEKAIEWVRTGEPTSRYRTIALCGSDHGRTGVCRTVSGRPELHNAYGPLMAGFAHVPVADIDALRKSIDDQTAAVLLCPLDFNDSARALSAKYLKAVRQLCDEQDLRLIIDESRLVLGSAGTPLVFSSLADIQADAVIIAGGIFAGLSGALLLANHRFSASPIMDTARYPLLTSVAVTTLQELVDNPFGDDWLERAKEFAIELAQRVADFPFVRDIHATGMTIGLETDLPAEDWIHASAALGLGVEAAGDTSILIQPPAVVDPEERAELLNRISATMQLVRRHIADSVMS